MIMEIEREWARVRNERDWKRISCSTSFIAHQRENTIEEANKTNRKLEYTSRILNAETSSGGFRVYQVEGRRSSDAGFRVLYGYPIGAVRLWALFVRGPFLVSAMSHVRK